MRHAITALVVLCAGCYGTGDPQPIDLPVAPASAISVVTAADTFSGSVAASSIVQKVPRCPAAVGVGLLAQTSDAGITAVFTRWPAEGSVFDLSLPGAEDDIVVSAQVGPNVYCTNLAAPASGTVEVQRFEQVGERYLIEVVLTSVVAGATTLDAHLYH